MYIVIANEGYECAGIYCGIFSTEEKAQYYIDAFKRTNANKNTDYEILDEEVIDDLFYRLPQSGKNRYIVQLKILTGEFLFIRTVDPVLGALDTDKVSIFSSYDSVKECEIHTVSINFHIVAYSEEDAIKIAQRKLSEISQDQKDKYVKKIAKAVASFEI